MKSDKIYSIAKDTYLEFGSCPQAVLFAMKKYSNYINEELIQASQSFSGGSGLVGFGACGALNGGLMAISAKFGRKANQFHDFDSVPNFKKSKQLIDWFKSEMNGFTCHDFQELINNKTYDMWDLENKQKLKSEKFKNNCAHMCGATAQKCIELLEENGQY